MTDAILHSPTPPADRKRLEGDYEGDDAMRAVVRAAVLGQSTGQRRRSADELGDAAVKELEVERFSAGGDGSGDGSSYIRNQRNIPIEEYLNPGRLQKALTL